MKKILKKATISFLVCLSACNSIPTIEVTQKKYDVDLNRCVKRQYVFSAEFIGGKGNSVEIPVDQCDELIGYTPDEYIKVFQWQEDRRKDWQEFLRP